MHILGDKKINDQGSCLAITERREQCKTNACRKAIAIKIKIREKAIKFKVRNQKRKLKPNAGAWKISIKLISW